MLSVAGRDLQKATFSWVGPMITWPDVFLSNQAVILMLSTFDLFSYILSFLLIFLPSHIRSTGSMTLISQRKEGCHSFDRVYNGRKKKEREKASGKIYETPIMSLIQELYTPAVGSLLKFWKNPVGSQDLRGHATFVTLIVWAIGYVLLDIFFTVSCKVYPINVP